MEPKQTELNKIRQVANDYKKNGYNVIVEPRGTDIPSFVKNYQPDIIATSDNDNVIIEVKTRSDFSTIDKLRDIADIVNKRKNWRFELIVTTTKQETQNETERQITELDLSEIEENLKAVKSILEQDLYSSAFVLTWATLESIGRQLLLEDKKKLNNRTPLVLIKTLFSFGYLTRTDLESLEKLFVVRNQVVHGYKVKGLDKKTVDKLLSITEKLKGEKQ
jgi:Holliday junction resolvase